MVISVSFQTLAFLWTFQLGVVSFVLCFWFDSGGFCSLFAEACLPFFGKETKEIEMGNLNPMWNASKQGGGSMKPRLPKTARTNAKGEMRQAAKLGRKDHGMSMSV